MDSAINLVTQGAIGPLVLDGGKPRRARNTDQLTRFVLVPSREYDLLRQELQARNSVELAEIERFWSTP